jgi:cysteine desulfuration protein SufE
MACADLILIKNWVVDVTDANEIHKKKDKILSELAALTSTDDRYKFIIEMGRRLPPLADDQRKDKFLIQGCMSQAWLVPEFKDGAVHFYVDSDALIVKGIMAILVSVYSGNPPGDNLGLSPEFLREGGITEHLSMNRRNGLSSVVKQIMLYSTAFLALSRR